MKYPKNTRQRMALRLSCRRHFNPNTGLPHTKAWLDHRRELGLRRGRRHAYATAPQGGGL